MSRVSGAAPVARTASHGRGSETCFQVPFRWFKSRRARKPKPSTATDSRYRRGSTILWDWATDECYQYDQGLQKLILLLIVAISISNADISDFILRIYKYGWKKDYVYRPEWVRKWSPSEFQVSTTGYAYHMISAPSAACCCSGCSRSRRFPSPSSPTSLQQPRCSRLYCFLCCCLGSAPSAPPRCGVRCRSSLGIRSCSRFSP